jgi:hypothetical protein
MSDPNETPGKRLYQIRLSYGDGTRTPEPLQAFAARVTKQTGERYHAATISLLERMEQEWRYSDFNALSRMDKQQRGAPWLAYGIEQPNLDVSELEVPDPRKDRKLTMQEIARAGRQAELERSEQARKARGGRGPAKRRRPPGGGAA